jgi:NAD(P)-dependent dehydrogenase (short-subunit alcohol dehydrogenase family)
VVNDLGVSLDGAGRDTSAADETVAAIKAAGGQAVANHDAWRTSAAAEAIVETAVREFGRLDILVNNAGILRDRMIFNMSETISTPSSPSI